MDERCRRMVIGYNYGTKFRTQEVITKLIAKNIYRCHECRGWIHRGEEYYQDRLMGWARFSTYHGKVYKHASGHELFYRKKLAPKRRFYTHLVCAHCWRGVQLYADGDLVKFINRSKPEGSKVSYAFWRK